MAYILKQLGTSKEQADMQQPIPHQEEVLVAAVKVAPPVAITGMTLAGYPLADWLILATLVYTILQLLLLLEKRFLPRKPPKE